MSYIYMKKKIYKLLFIEKNYAYVKELLIDNKAIDKSKKGKLQIYIHYSPFSDIQHKVRKLKLTGDEFYEISNLFQYYTLNGELMYGRIYETDYDDEPSIENEIDHIFNGNFGIKYHNKFYFIEKKYQQYESLSPRISII